MHDRWKVIAEQCISNAPAGLPGQALRASVNIAMRCAMLDQTPQGKRQLARVLRRRPTRGIAVMPIREGQQLHPLPASTLVNTSMSRFSLTLCASNALLWIEHALC